jgi:hypothetical protein
MTTRVCWTLVCAVSVAGTACIKQQESRTEEQFCQEYAHIECGKVAALCSFTAANCEPARVAACRTFAAQLKGAGHEFNAAHTDACLKKLGDAYMTLPNSATMLKAIDDTCARVFEGTAKVTEGCMADYDCAGGLICDKGHCGVEKIVSSGGLCANPGERCPKGEFCTSATGVFICTKRAPLGMSCSLSVPCEESLRCRTTCVPKLDTQGACDQDDDCISGYCNRYVSTRTCGLGLTFSPESASCTAYMGNPDGGLPGRGTNEVADAAPDVGVDMGAADTGASSD